MLWSKLILNILSKHFKHPNKVYTNISQLEDALFRVTVKETLENSPVSS